ncbi:MAG: YegS/Rv2252/BmrU family lipid kinase [Nitriliruptoraceae bacterium]
MEHPYGQPLVVVNARAGRHTLAIADELDRLLISRGINANIHPATSSQDVIETCTKAVTDRQGYVIVVGGDGTVRDAVSGFFLSGEEMQADDLPVLGIVGSGTGSDFTRTFGLDRPVSTLIDHLVSAAVTTVDVGVIACQTANGTPVQRHFLNVAQIGFGATVVATANRLPKRLGRQRYRTAIPFAIAQFRHQPMRVSLDHTEITEDLLNVVIANGQFYGAGLHVAPQAMPHDGVFDVQCWTVSPRDLPVAYQQLARGDHLGRDDVRQWRSSQVHVHGPRAIPVEADGDVIGVTPAAVTIRPHGLRIKI